MSWLIKKKSKAIIVRKKKSISNITKSKVHKYIMTKLYCICIKSMSLILIYHSPSCQIRYLRNRFCKNVPQYKHTQSLYICSQHATSYSFKGGAKIGRVRLYCTTGTLRSVFTAYTQAHLFMTAVF